MLDGLAPHEQRIEDRMWSIADRMVKAVSDVTVGTVIVLVHVALADRSRRGVERDGRYPTLGARRGLTNEQAYRLPS
jgi:hypothetical protein